MPTWSGWQNQLLNAAGVPTSSSNRAFLSAWASHAGTSCARNPIDLSAHESGSGDCHTLTPSRTAQHYPSHASAGQAFHDQLRSNDFLDLSVAFFNSRLSVTNASDAVINNVRVWGSTLFANYLFDQRSGSGTGATDVTGPGVHEAWNHLRRAVNHTLPNDLHANAKATSAALRSLGRARKVKI